MKDIGDASYVIGIKIHRDKFRGVLGLSQETYINKVLKRFQMKNCSPSIAPIVKGDRLNLNQCPKNDFERERIKNIPYKKYSICICCWKLDVCSSLYKN